jgi:NAD(P)-dependent dehydrogenase (short-subunit alcohol dehydrogenase family)
MNKRLIVIGGNGALGSAFVNTFKKSPSPWKVLSLDFTKNSTADYNLVLNQNSFRKDILIGIRKEISEFSSQFDLVVNVAGGWNGVGLKDDNIFDSLDLMLKQNLFSSVLGVHLAYHFLKKDSHLVLTGAMSPFLNQGYNFMMTYQLSKNSVHHLTEIVNWNKEDNFRILTLLP